MAANLTRIRDGDPLDRGEFALVLLSGGVHLVLRGGAGGAPRSERRRWSSRSCCSPA